MLVTLFLCLYSISQLFEAWSNSLWPVFPRKIKIFFSKDNLCLNICDNGGGISNEVNDNIFEARFTTKEKGSGMGLYLSKTIMERLGGDISVMNKGYGVKFSLKFKG